MICPFCASTDTSVTNSRVNKKSPKVWRRRHCNHCKKTYTTHEIPSYDQIALFSPSGAKMTFSYPKLFISVYKACEALPRAAEDASALTNTIIEQLLRANKNGLTTDEIVDVCCKTLKRYDASAFVRYISSRSNLSSSRELKRALKFYQ